MPVQALLDIFVTNVTGFGKTDGIISLNVSDGTAPYVVTLMQGNSTIAQNNNVIDEAFPNCIFADLAPGYYNVFVEDSTVDGKGNPIHTTTENTEPIEVMAPPRMILDGDVIAMGAETTVSFEVGKEPGSYTEEYPIHDTIPAGESRNVTFTAGSGNYSVGKYLQPGTEYNYRIKAVNANGLTYGQERLFTTPGSPPEATTNEAYDPDSQQV